VNLENVVVNLTVVAVKKVKNATRLDENIKKSKVGVVGWCNTLDIIDKNIKGILLYFVFNGTNI
jgi:hypothetical protein